MTPRIFASNTLVVGPLIHKPAIGYDPETIPVASHSHSLFAQDPYEFYPTPIFVQILQVFFISLISATLHLHTASYILLSKLCLEMCCTIYLQCKGKAIPL